MLHIFHKFCGFLFKKWTKKLETRAFKVTFVIQQKVFTGGEALQKIIFFEFTHHITKNKIFIGIIHLN